MRTLVLPFALALLVACNGKHNGDTSDTNQGDSSTNGDSSGDSASDSNSDSNSDSAAGTDADGDGHTSTATGGDDCDDTNAAIYPGAPEVCDGLDNDCDGVVDPDTSIGAPTWYADQDADGYGDASNTMTSCSQPVGYVASDGDCNDTDPAYNPGASESDCADPNDYNCDGSTGYADADGDGFPACQECDDSNAAVNPDATEICDGIDNNCDGTVDEDSAADATIWYADVDGDGYGDDTMMTTACNAPDGYVAQGGDCNDADPAYNPGATEADCTDPNDYNCDGSTGYADADGDGVPACEDCDDANAAINPSATELCDGVDNNCDGTVDENTAADVTTWYADVDGDGTGDPTTTYTSCSAPAGFIADSSDCDDSNSAVNPSATEVCDGIDNNCDGAIDETGASGGSTWYTDADGDTYGDPASPVTACTQPSGTVSDDTDCDDTQSLSHPGATEFCDGKDNDCNGLVDDGATDFSTFYADADGDGFGTAETSESACTAPAGFVSDSSDCDDTAAAVNPAATEVCNGVDDDCDGTVDVGAVDMITWYQDGDSDGYGGVFTEASCEQPAGYVNNSDDCDDANAAAYPGNPETCDGVDNDCNGTVDDNATDATTYYQDSDGDTHGNAAATLASCSIPAGYVSSSDDCNDASNVSFPGAPEICDGLDNNCNSVVDDFATDATTWYLDADGDGYGNASTTMSSCSMPAGYVANSTDCNDADDTVHPGAAEVCDGLDQDCDGVADNGLAVVSQYLDGDGDGYGSTTAGAACLGLPGYSTVSTDCDDTNADAYPGNAETDDGIDNDCDGWVDEDFVSVGDIVISEIARQPYVGGSATVENAEWFEVYNASARTVDLSNWYFIRAASSSDYRGFFVDPTDSVTVAPGDYLTFCRTSTYEGSSGASYPEYCDYVWGDPTQVATYSGTYHTNQFQFGRDSDSLSLYINGGSGTGTKIDSITWYYDTSGATTASNWPRDGGRSMSLDPAHLDATSNNTNTNWCSTTSSSTYSWYKSGTKYDYGTPGSANYDCP